MFCLWAIVGMLLGTGVGYFISARQVPVFESTATMKLVSVGAAAVGGMSTDSSDVPLQQQDAVTDANAIDDDQVVSGFRMTDDAAKDVLLIDSAELQDDGPVGGPGNKRKSEPVQQLRRGLSQPPKAASLDDSSLFCSQAVLERAVELGELNKIQELQWMVSARDQSPEAFVRAWVNDGHMRVEKSGESSLGGVYRIAFRSRLPSTSEKVVQAIAKSAVEKFDNSTLQKQQAKVLDLLASGRIEIDAKIRDLEDRLSAVPEVTGAMLRDGEVVSPDAVRLDAIVSRFERLQLKRDALKQNLVRAEALLAEGADKGLVFAVLGTPLPQPKLESGLQAEGPVVTPNEAGDSSKAADEYRIWLEMRNELVEKVEREVAPMQKKLDALIEKKYGPNHPAVSHLRGQIGRIRAQLANLPPEPDGVEIGIPETNETKTEPRGAAASGKGLGDGLRGKDIALDSLLEVVRSELGTVSEQIARLDPELEELSTTVASQDRALRQHESLEREIGQQQRLRSEMIKQIETINSRGTGSEISCELLVPASAGVQVEPDLRAHLLAGGMLGGASGAVLFLLILMSVTAVAAGDGGTDP